jgi:hypothetical protein
MRARSTGTAILFGLLFCCSAASAQQPQPLANFVKESEIKATIDRWQKARGLYYSTLYDRPLSVAVTGEAPAILVNGYKERTLPFEVAKLGPPSVAAMVQTDVEVVLNRAFLGEVTARFGSLGGLVENLLQRKVDKIEINDKRVRTALEEEDCRVIPCDPKKCDPDTCIRRSKERAFPGRK